nr:RNA-directed DNA polymerase, eukaryota, reverse transcriptase zinc-binding domain protein [Tanacetum cinerariifolium]
MLLKLRDIEHVKSLDAYQKAKIKWGIEADENIKFFHGIINKNRQGLAIKGIIKDGIWFTDRGEIKDIFREFFVEKFKHFEGVNVTRRSDHYKTLSPAQASLLEHLVSELKIYDAVQDVAQKNISVPTVFPLLSTRNTEAYLKLILWPLFGSFLKLANFPQKQSLMIFKVDFEKAFDLVSWDFLDRVIAFMGFGCRRRGDPLSPFLFILVMEALHVAVEDAIDVGLYRGVQVLLESTTFLFFPMPKQINKRLESLRVNFFWGCTDGIKKIPWISWNSILASKLKCGLVNVTLTEGQDTWQWNLIGSNIFNVKDTRLYIDSILNFRLRQDGERFRDNPNDVFGWLDHAHHKTAFKIIMHSIFGVVVWKIWQFRNNNIFGDKKMLQQDLYDQIMDASFLWYSSRNRNCDMLDLMEPVELTIVYFIIATGDEGVASRNRYEAEEEGVMDLYGNCVSSKVTCRERMILLVSRSRQRVLQRHRAKRTRPHEQELRSDITVVAVGPYKPGVGPAKVPHDGLGKCTGPGLIRLWEWVDIGHVNIRGKLWPVMRGEPKFIECGQSDRSF